ncbi:MAG: sec-independent protein translocase protein TatC [Miltoncostaeaceae bacterium]|nr:sec-independent protein translocase protein TatC [Miltoncostaeaceae bacterium]
MSLRAPSLGLRRVGPAERLPLVSHLDELRRRVIVSALALLAAFGALYAVHDPLMRLIQAPLPDGQRLVTLSPTEPFMTVLKVVFWAAILVALPIWLYQLYAFVVPAVAHQTRRVSLAVVGGVAALFGAGVAFGYLVVLPVSLRFLLGFGQGLFTVQLRADEYFAFATTMLLAAGLLFEVPAAMVALSRLGVAGSAAFRRHRRLAIVVIAAIAAVLPGGDPLSMIMLMIPQLVLFEVGIRLTAVLERSWAPLLARDATPEQAPAC